MSNLLTDKILLPLCLKVLSINELVTLHQRVKKVLDMKTARRDKTLLDHLVVGSAVVFEGDFNIPQNGTVTEIGKTYVHVRGEDNRHWKIIPSRLIIV